MSMTHPAQAPAVVVTLPSSFIECPRCGLHYVFKGMDCFQYCRPYLEQVDDS
jgi:hypothetical protein